ncbi:hypothetical protein Tco_1365994 [Tanacetum coccineum]
MDSMIPLGQKNTLVEYMILSGADNHPSMLEKDLVTRTKKYAELSAIEKIQADCDMKATNIILQGLPADIYSLERECKLKPYDASPGKIEAPKELPKLSLVNESLKKLKFHLARFDNVVKVRTTPHVRRKGEWGFEHTKAVFNNEIIPFLKSLKDIFNVFDRDLLNEIMEVQTIFDQMDAAVQQSSVDK